MKLKDNIIFIENGDYSKIKKALEQWIALYIENLDPNLKIEIFEGVNQNIIIKIGYQIENEIFHYLINYLVYPENINYKIRIEGFTKINDNKIYPKELVDESVMIYIPDNDTEYDYVLGVTESNKNFKIDFGGNFKIIDSKRIFKKPSKNVDFNKSERFIIQKGKSNIPKRKGKLEKFNFRFLIIASLFLSISTIIGYFSYNTYDFVSVLKFSSFGLFLWVMLEFEVLHYKSAFIKFLILSIILASIGYYFINIYGDIVWLKATKMSLCFLILYKILRYFYIQKYEREPEFDRSAEKKIDRLFSFILLIGTAFSSFL